MSLVSRINSSYNELTKTERKIADYILKNNQELAFMTLDDLADRIGVSTTSVIRLARTLRYGGYTQMQQAVRKNLIKKVSLPERFDENYSQLNEDSLLNDLLNAEIDALKKTASSIDTAALKEAAKAIRTARNVYILGARSTYCLAHYLAVNLSQTKSGVRLISGVGGMYPEEIAEACEEDVCIAYMFPRYQNMLSSLLSWLKSKGVKVILISVEPYTAIAHLGDIFLCCKLQSGLMTKDSLIPPMLLNNYLFTYVSGDDYEASHKQLENMEEILNTGFYFGG